MNSSIEMCIRSNPKIKTNNPRIRMETMSKISRIAIRLKVMRYSFSRVRTMLYNVISIFMQNLTASETPILKKVAVMKVAVFMR